MDAYHDTKINRLHRIHRRHIVLPEHRVQFPSPESKRDKFKEWDEEERRRSDAYVQPPWEIQ